MNRILAFLFFMLFLAGAAFVMLKDLATAGPSGPAASVNLLAGDWKLPESGAYVRFSSDGKVNGFGGCNSFFGTFVATDLTIDIEPLSATRKTCPEPIMSGEQQVLRALETASHYEISGTTLTLGDSGGETLQLILDTVTR